VNRLKFYIHPNAGVITMMSLWKILRPVNFRFIPASGRFGPNGGKPSTPARKRIASLEAPALEPAPEPCHALLG
jgi:hypothetical protein